jgi:hypothetical protein
MRAFESIKSALAGFHRDRSATTMTEFVIVLPIMVMIFVGMNELGSYGRISVETRVEATHRTFSDVYDVHRSNAETLSAAANDAYLSDATHLNPSAAMIDAQLQLQDHPIRQESSFSQMLVRSQEMGTYTALALSGHLGEAYARLQPALLMPNSYVPGLYEAIRADSDLLFGRMSADGSLLAYDLLYDGIGFSFNIDQCQGALETITSVFNQGLGAAGIRPMLSAAMRYGTVTGSVDTTVNIPAVGDRQVYAYFNTAVPPFVFEKKPGLQPALTMIFTRLAMLNCAMKPYSGLMGVGGNQNLPPVGQGVLNVPSPSNQAPGDYNDFKNPLNYYDRSETEKP